MMATTTAMSRLTLRPWVGSSTLSRNGFRGPGNRALVLSEHLLEVAQQGHPRGTA